MTDHSDDSTSINALPAEQETFESRGSLTTGSRKLNYQATAGWLPLFKDERESARMFFTYYRISSRGRANSRSVAKRPLTFVFNGGPGAASAYLHIGALGPKRVDTPADGSLPASPVRLVDNAETWLGFTDLVFVDPVGTGLSRTTPEKQTGGSADKDKPNGRSEDTFYWDVSKDLESLCDFISGFLSKQSRWSSPIHLAGESYGGYRVGRLVRMLQEKAGVGLSGATLISPVFEWDTLFAGRFNSLAAAMSIPSFAAAARFHGRAAQARSGESLPDFLRRAERFALADYLPTNALGGTASAATRRKAVNELARWIGLDPELLSARGGRIDRVSFCRELLREEHKVLGWYDAATTTEDPFPASDVFEGVDPTLGGLNRVYVAAANTHIRENLGVDSERTYELLNYAVNRKWQWRDELSGTPVPPGATDDLAVGLTMNPDMKLLVVHGVYDLVTPYFESKHLLQQLVDGSSAARHIRFAGYEGGHMFYMWRASRRAFTRDARRLY